MEPGPSTSRDGGEFVPIVLGNMTNDSQTKPKLFANHPEPLEVPKFQREQRDCQPLAYRDRPAFHPLEVGLPNPELKFDGDPTRYSLFMANFEAHLESRLNPTDDASKLQYLIQHCKGEARTLIDFCSVLDFSADYQKAKQLLFENYGRLHVIARTYVNKLSKGQRLKSGDSAGLVMLAHDLEESRVALNHLKYYSDLNNFDNIAKIIERLPFDLQKRRLQLAAAIEGDRREPSFEDLVYFVQGEARVVQSSYGSLLKKGQSNISRVSSHVTSADHIQIRDKCSLCAELYRLADCKKFNDKNAADRVAHVREKRLCFSCLRAGHISKRCFMKAVCKVTGCSSNHHTMLHERFAQKPWRNRVTRSCAVQTMSDELSSKVCNVRGEKITTSLNVVHLRITANGKEVKTNAFLDQNSTTTLCDERLVDALGLHGEPATFALSTTA